MTDTPDLQAVLASYEKQRAELDIVIAHLRKLLGMSPDAEAPSSNAASEPVASTTLSDRPPSGQDVRSDTFFQMSIPAAAKKYLMMVKRPMETAEIASALKQGGILSQAKNFYVGVHTAMTRDNSFTRVHGKWGMTDWYPNRPKAAEPSKKSSSKRKTKKSSKPKETAKTGQSDA